MLFTILDLSGSVAFSIIIPLSFIRNSSFFINNNNNNCNNNNKNNNSCKSAFVEKMENRNFLDFVRVVLFQQLL